MNFEDIKFGKSYEEEPEQSIRIIYFFIKKKGSKVLCAEVKNYEFSDIQTTFEIVTKKDWSDENNLYSHLKLITIPMYYYRSVILEIFDSSSKPEWQSLRRSLKYF